MIKSSVVEANKPIEEMLRELHQTVHGTEKEPETGLAKRTTKIENFQKTTLYIFTIITAIGAAFTAVLLLFHSGILKIG